ncbi:unnamed protein product [Trichogramma brassicae]|uniref:Uncharacterized protein n=1 Tax=Trichogramma brassicae TaxID=86971 RepID=A0A6H5HT01_9HYME|nr:unnamed protein product [Trichogramma brassicae]
MCITPRGARVPRFARSRSEKLSPRLLSARRSSSSNATTTTTVVVVVVVYSALESKAPARLLRLEEREKRSREYMLITFTKCKLIKEREITATGRGIPEGHPLPRRASPGQVHSGAREGGHPCPGRLQPGEGEAPPRPAVPGPHSARSSGDPPATQRLEGQEGEREVGSRESTNSCEEDPGEEVAPSIPQILRHRGTDPYCRLTPQHQEEKGPCDSLPLPPPHFLRHLHRSTGRSNARLTTNGGLNVGLLEKHHQSRKLHCCEEEYHAHHNSPADEENYPETESDHTEPQKEGDKPITSESE